MSVSQRLLFALLLVIAGPAFAKDHVYGPAPDWARYKVLGEAGVRAKLPDPDNYQIEWPNGYMQELWDHKGDFSGYLTCGVMRAAVPVKNRHLLTNFVIVIDNDQVKTVDISSRESNSLVNIACEDFVRRGRLPPARLMEGPTDLPVTSLGLEIRVMPEGAYIVAATAGLPAQRAGLVPGMVITRANGIALAGLGAAMAQILGTDVASLALETATGDRVYVKRAP